LAPSVTWKAIGQLSNIMSTTLVIPPDTAPMQFHMWAVSTGRSAGNGSWSPANSSLILWSLTLVLRNRHGQPTIQRLSTVETPGSVGSPVVTGSQTQRLNAALRWLIRDQRLYQVLHQSITSLVTPGCRAGRASRG
jgi:hypothetical protein